MTLIIQVLKFITDHLENGHLSSIGFVQLNNFLKSTQEKKKKLNIQAKGLPFRNFTHSRTSKSRPVNKRLINSQEKSNRPSLNPKKARIYDNIGDIMNLNRQ